MMRIEIDTQIENQLKAFALHHNCSPEALANAILREQVSQRSHFEQEKDEDTATLSAMEKGREFSNEEVMEWLDSWGTNNEKPCPTLK